MTSPEKVVNNVGEKERRAGLAGWSLLAALVALGAFGLLVGYMLSQVAATEIHWNRVAWIVGSVEAIAFGAAGALFGATIQRERAEAVETEAAKNSEEASNGRALAAGLTSEAETALGAAGPGGRCKSGRDGSRRRRRAKATARRVLIRHRDPIIPIWCSEQSAPRLRYMWDDSAVRRRCT